MHDDEDLDEDQLAALPIFPLPNVVLLPGIVLPLNVFEPRYLDLVDHVMARGGYLGVPLLRTCGTRSERGQAPIEPVFGLGRMISHQELVDGRRFIRVEGIRRVRCCAELPTDAAFRQLQVELLAEDHPQNQHQLEVLRAQLERISRSLADDDQQLLLSILGIPDPRVMLYAVAAIIPTFGCVSAGPGDGSRSPVLEIQQGCLQALDADDRVEWLLSCSQTICDELSCSGRFPRSVLN